MSRAFVHHLHVVLPGDLRQLALRLELGELRLVVRVRDRSRPQTIAEGKRHVIRRMISQISGSASYVKFFPGDAPGTTWP